MIKPKHLPFKVPARRAQIGRKGVGRYVGFWSNLLRIERKSSFASPDAALLEMFGCTPTAAGVTVTVESALRVPAVQCAIRVVSEAVATLPAYVSQEVSGEYVRKPEHPAQALLSSEWNGWTSAYEGLLSMVIDAQCRDEGALAWVNRVGGKPVEIIRYAPGVVSVLYDTATGEPSYRIGAGPLNPADIIHVRPLGPLCRAPLTLAREAIGLAIVMALHASKLFANGARPSGVLALKGNASADTITKIREAWQLAHGGDKSGGTAIVGSEASYQQLTLTSVDSQFLELRTFQIQEIARAFRVPPHMLFDLGRATWSNSEQMGLEFLSYTLQPWLDNIKGALRRALFTAEERAAGYCVEFETDDLTRADIGARAVAYSSLVSSRVFNPNEIRRWEGAAPYKGGDEFVNPHTTPKVPNGPA